MAYPHAATAARAFEEALQELDLPEDAPDTADPAVLGRRAALLAVAETLWGQYLGPLFEVEQVKILLKVTSRQAVSDLARRGRLLALDTSDGRKLYPAFQFSTSGRPYSEVQKILKIFTGAVQSPYTIASWFTTPQDLLEGEKPAHWMRSRREPELLFEAARRAAARLGQ